MFAGILGGEALLIGGLGGGLDVIGTVGATLDDGFTAIKAAVVSAGKVAFEPIDRDNVLNFHKIINYELRIKYFLRSGGRILSGKTDEAFLKGLGRTRWSRDDREMVAELTAEWLHTGLCMTTDG